jgi:hypothetical protein
MAAGMFILRRIIKFFQGDTETIQEVPASEPIALRKTTSVIIFYSDFTRIIDVFRLQSKPAEESGDTI